MKVLTSLRIFSLCRKSIPLETVTGVGGGDRYQGLRDTPDRRVESGAERSLLKKTAGIDHRVNKNEIRGLGVIPSLNLKCHFFFV